MRESVKKWVFVILFLVFALFVIIFLLIAPAEAQAPPVVVDIIPTSFSPARGGFVIELIAIQAVHYRVTVLWPKQLSSAELPVIWRDHEMRIYPSRGVHSQVIVGWRSNGILPGVVNEKREWSGAEGTANVFGAGQTRVEIRFSYPLLQKLEREKFLLVVEWRVPGRTEWIVRDFGVKTIPKSPPTHPAPPVPLPHRQEDLS